MEVLKTFGLGAFECSPNWRQEYRQYDLLLSLPMRECYKVTPTREGRGRFCKGLKHRRIQIIIFACINSFVYSMPGSMPGFESMILGSRAFRNIDGQ